MARTPNWVGPGFEADGGPRWSSQTEGVSLIWSRRIPPSGPTEGVDPQVAAVTVYQQEVLGDLDVSCSNPSSWPGHGSRRCPRTLSTGVRSQRCELPIPAKTS